MTPKLVDRDETILVGVARDVSSSSEIAALWQEFTAGEKAIEHVVEGVGYEVQTYPEGHTAGQPFYCFVGVEVRTAGDLPPAMVARPLPAGRYAIFTHRSAEGFDRINREIDQWLEDGAYKPAHDFSVQVYGPAFRGMDDPTSEIEMWIPVAEK
jgi:AraC family transcriptional regulator